MTPPPAQDTGEGRLEGARCPPLSSEHVSLWNLNGLSPRTILSFFKRRKEVIFCQEMCPTSDRNIKLICIDIFGSTVSAGQRYERLSPMLQSPLQVQWPIFKSPIKFSECLHNIP